MSEAPERICLPPIEDGAPIEEWLVPSIYSPPCDEMIPDDWSEYIRADVYEEVVRRYDQHQSLVLDLNLRITELEQQANCPYSHFTGQHCGFCNWNGRSGTAIWEAQDESQAQNT